ncbi:hypothetical protein MUU49_07295 [Scandinavium goeteborgense]|uniref:hypothetical protein n=1 Tax=Scandinavium goeteborgense TaxID=1851514 RepID=UPI0021654EA3|nr:hypothetical protein [Scandinavium goeteborgense]MCS2152388.1 hypothetical protein [Scandinavium goeteborgense]
MSTPLIETTPPGEVQKCMTEETADLWRRMERLITGFRCNAVEDSGLINSMIDHMCQTMRADQLAQAIKILGREISLGSTEMRRKGLYGYPWDKR